MEKIVLGVLVGAAAGFAVGYMAMRAGGSCPIMCNPYMACAFGAVMGGAIAAGVGGAAPSYTPSPHLIRVENEEAFDKAVLQDEGPVLVDFSSTRCYWCGRLEPVVHALADRYAGRMRVVEFNVDRAPSVIQRHGIEGFPMLILFKGGKEVERVLGYRDERAMAALLDPFAPETQAPGEP